MKSLAGLFVAALAALSIGVSSAGANTAVTVSLVNCYFNQGGNATVPAGSDVYVRVGWGESNRGRVRDFLNAQTTTADVNGTPVANASNLWGAIAKTDLIASPAAGPATPMTA